MNLVSQWVQNFLSLDNSRVNTGAVIATIAIVNAFVVLNWNFFVYHRPLDNGTVALLSTMIGCGGWTYHASMRAGFPPPNMGPPGTHQAGSPDPDAP